MLFEVLLILLGIGIIFITLYSAVRSLVLPRGAPDSLTGFVFSTMRYFFILISKPSSSFIVRDRILAYLTPISLLLLVPVWFTLVTIGYTFIYWSLSAFSWLEAFRLSGSSLLTLGFSSSPEPFINIIIFSEATLGLMLVALLIAYLPTIYSAFSRRESAVTMLEVRAGNPPSAVEMILRFNRIHGLDHLTEQWQIWEKWFTDIQESHTSLSGLVFLRSPVPGHSWVTAAGTVLDAASITLSTIDIPSDPNAALCLRAGYLALRQIADFFSIPISHDPKYPEVTISVTREEFNEAYYHLKQHNIPVKPDIEEAWSDFAGWRVNYDMPLLALANLTVAPYAKWSSDRSK